MPCRPLLLLLLLLALASVVGSRRCLDHDTDTVASNRTLINMGWATCQPNQYCGQMIAGNAHYRNVVYFCDRLTDPNLRCNATGCRFVYRYPGLRAGWILRLKHVPDRRHRTTKYLRLCCCDVSQDDDDGCTLEDDVSSLTDELSAVASATQAKLTADLLLIFASVVVISCRLFIGGS